MKYTVRNSKGAIILSNCKDIIPEYTRHIEKEGFSFEIILQAENIAEKKSTKNRSVYFEVLANEAFQTTTSKFSDYNHIVSTISVQLMQKIQGYFSNYPWYRNNYSEAIESITSYLSSDQHKTAELIHYFNKIAFDLNSHVEGWDIIYLKNSYDPENSEVSLRKAILSQYNPFSESFNESGLHLRLSDDFSDDVRASLDKKLFSLIMYNFFSNSVKYAMPDSEIWINYDDLKKTVDISMYSAKMEKSEIVSLFKDGARGKFANDVSSSGNGTGLYVIKRSLELMSLPNMYIDPEYDKTRTTDSITFVKNHFIFDLKKAII